MNLEQQIYFMIGYSLSGIVLAIGILTLSLTLISLGTILNFVVQIYGKLLRATADNNDSMRSSNDNKKRK